MIRSTFPLALVPFAALLALAGCRATAAEPPASSSHSRSIETLADRLVRAAELRVDPGSMRVSVHAVDEELAWGRASSASAPTVSPLGQLLEQELAVALSGRLHVLDGELARGELARGGPGRGGTDAPPADLSAEEAARRLGATHLLVASFVPSGDDVVLTIRLVDAESLVNVAAARGAVPVRPLRERLHARWRAADAASRLVSAPAADPPSPEPVPAADEFPARPALGEPAARELATREPAPIAAEPAERTAPAPNAAPADELAGEPRITREQLAEILGIDPEDRGRRPAIELPSSRARGSATDGDG